MKKLKTLAFLLLITLAFTACNNNPAEEEKDKKETVKENEPMFSQKTIDSLSDTAYFGDISLDKEWKMQECIIYKDKKYKKHYQVSEWQNLYDQLSDEDKTTFDSWTDGTQSCCYLPVDERKEFTNFNAESSWSGIFDVDDVVVCNVVKTSNTIIKRFLTDFSWEDDIGTNTEKIKPIFESDYKTKITAMKNLTFKTNSSKTKFYATKTDEDGNVYHYYVMKD